MVVEPNIPIPETGGGETGQPRSWAEIDIAALRHNFRVAASAGKGVIAIVKADGYGHGVLAISQALEGENGLIAFGVATCCEALELRRGGISAPVLILGTSLPDERETLVAEGFWPSVSGLEEAKAFDVLGSRFGKTVPLHLAVDTGMGRMGIPEHQFDENLARRLADLQNIDVSGLASHFPSADEDPEFTRNQTKRFRNVLTTARAGGLAPKWIHLANSAGILGFADEIEMTNAVRPGLMLYGVSPLPEFRDRLQPVLSLKSRIALIRDIPQGHGISYGRTFITREPARIATLAIGYGDGLMRHLSGQGAEILIGEKRCPLLGRVTMDQIMADVSLLEKLNPGDEAVLIGKQGAEEITAAEMARKAETIPWEIFTALTKRVPRIYTG